MGLFEETIEAGMSDPECRRGWFEAEAELAAYCASIAPHIVDAPSFVMPSGGTVALGEQIGEPNHWRPPAQFAPPLVTGFVETAKVA